MPRTLGVAATDSGLVGWLAETEPVRRPGVALVGVGTVIGALAVEPEGWPGNDGGKASVRGDGATEPRMSLARRCSLNRFGLGLSRATGVLLTMYSHASGFFDFLHLLQMGCVWSQATLRLRHGSQA